MISALPQLNPHGQPLAPEQPHACRPLTESQLVASMQGLQLEKKPLLSAEAQTGSTVSVPPVPVASCPPVLSALSPPVPFGFAPPEPPDSAAAEPPAPPEPPVAAALEPPVAAAPEPPVAAPPEPPLARGDGGSEPHAR